MIGDTVNLASRLEQANKFYGTRILVSAETRRLAGDALAFREIDSLRVAGKQEPIQVHELLGYRADLAPGLQAGVAAFESGLAHYRKQEWDAAEAAFRQCLAQVPDDRPSQVLIERMQLFRETPLGPDWDGVWVALSK